MLLPLATADEVINRFKENAIANTIESKTDSSIMFSPIVCVLKIKRYFGCFLISLLVQ